MLISKKLPHVGIVVCLYRNERIRDHFFFLLQFPDKVSQERRLRLIVGSASLVCDRKAFRVFSEFFDQFEQLGFLNSQQCLGSQAVYLFL